MSVRTIWAVADSRRGVENQALGLAEALARAMPGAAVHRVTIRPDGFATLPASDAPDVWIGCGRPAKALAGPHRRSFPRAAFIYVQDPRGGHDQFDAVVAPAHDRLRTANAIAMIGSPHRVTADTLAAAKTAFAAQLDALPGPRAAILIGGPSKRFRMDGATQDYLHRRIADLRGMGLALMITVSRRTPKALTARLKADFAGDAHVWLYDGEGDNPYFAFLAGADWIFVTEDSTNMMTEAASTGIPVHSLPLAGRPGKFARLHAALQGHGALRPFLGRLDRWTYPPLRETERVADLIAARLAARA